MKYVDRKPPSGAKKWDTITFELAPESAEILKEVCTKFGWTKSDAMRWLFHYGILRLRNIAKEFKPTIH